MCRFLLLVIASCIVVGCDAQEERPLTLAERVAGSWELTLVRDGGRGVTNAFMQSTGTVKLELESVGCCAGSADYRFVVTRPDGEVIESRSFYLANDNPNDAGDFIHLLSRDSPLALVLLYEFDRSFTEMTLTASGSLDEINADLTVLGVDYEFRREAVFVFDKLD